MHTLVKDDDYFLCNYVLSQHYQVGTWFMFSLPQCNNVVVIIDFCLYFRLGELRIISENTKRLLRDNERIKWNEYYDDFYDDYLDDYDYDDYDDDCY